MAIKVLTTNLREEGHPRLSINHKVGRGSLNKAAMELLDEHYPKTTNFIQILVDDEKLNTFWVRLCDGQAEGARKINRPTKGTATISIRSLMSDPHINLSKESSVCLEWDKEIKAALGISKS